MKPRFSKPLFSKYLVTTPLHSSMEHFWSELLHMKKKSFVHYFSYFSILWWLLLIATTPTSATTYIVWFKPFDLTPNKELSRLLSFNHITHKVRTTNLIIIVKLLLSSHS